MEPRGKDKVTIALDMGLDVTSKLDQVLNKLAKFDAIETTLNQRMIGMKSEVSKLKDDMGEARKRLDEMDKGLQWLNTEINVFQGKIKDLERSKEYLHTKQLYTESYSRRENLKFSRIEERETRGESEDSEKVDTHDIPGFDISTSPVVGLVKWHL